MWTQLKQFDSDGDGRVSLAEYVAGFEAFLSQRDTFMNGMTVLVDAFYAKDEWMQNLEEYYFSEDPEAPGNWLTPIPEE